MAFAAPATPALAYVDPNIGGQLYQALYPLIALVLGVIAFARQWVTAAWTSLMARFRKPKPPEPSDLN